MNPVLKKTIIILNFEFILIILNSIISTEVSYNRIIKGQISIFFLVISSIGLPSGVFRY